MKGSEPTSTATAIIEFTSNQTSQVSIKSGKSRSSLKYRGYRTKLQIQGALFQSLYLNYQPGSQGSGSGFDCRNAFSATPNCLSDPINKLAATVALMMAAVAPLRLEARSVNIEYSTPGHPVDVKVEREYTTAVSNTNQTSKQVGDLERQIRREEEMEVDNVNKDYAREAVLTPPRRRGKESDMVEEDLSEQEQSSDDEPSDESNSDTETPSKTNWEKQYSASVAASIDVAGRDNCVFCRKDEDHDPNEEYEEYMACAVCGDNSHRKCARDSKSLGLNEDPHQWRCPGCVSNSLEPENREEAHSRRRSSATRLTRDLLPASRGISRPNSHSVFNNLILDDDPLDGSRSLRKRKASSEPQDQPIAIPKRRRVNRDGKQSESGASASPARAIDGNNSVRGFAPLVPELVDVNFEAGSISTRRPRSSLPASHHANPSQARSSGARSSRASKSRASDSASTKPIFVYKNVPGSLIIGIRGSPTKLSEILKIQPKKKRRRSVRSSRPARPSRSARPHVGKSDEEAEATRNGRDQDTDDDDKRPIPSFSTHYATPFYSFHERENDDLKSKPYGGILSEADADTSKTLPLAADRARFNDARTKAEEEWKKKTAALEAEIEVKGRSSQKVAGPPSKIKCVNFGGYEIETWYAAPYPEEYSRNKVLYICEFCLKYMNSDFVAWRHKLKCPAKHPPGDEIYRSGSISVFEVDGRKNPVYCQNLCLLAKLFLGSKTLYYDVEPFLFYVMTEYDELGCHFVGYFSKEKRPSSQNNVSCILTLPTHQRKGYGNLLISFSYLLTRAECKTGSPEKPLSDMGLVSYRNYWRLVLSYELINQKTPLSIADLSDRTGMTADDIVAALEGLRALVRDPVTKTYALRLDFAYFKQCIDGWESKGYVKLDPKALTWTPYIMGRSNLAHYDRAPAEPIIVPRTDKEKEKAVPEEGVQQAVAAVKSGIEASAKVQTNDNVASPSRNEVSMLVNGIGTVHLQDQVTPSNSSNSNLLVCAPPASEPNLLNTPPASTPYKEISQPYTPAPSRAFPSTPSQIDSTSKPSIPDIPAVRYEVYPPIPGTVARRRGGWGGARRRTTGAPNGTPGTRTPLRRGGKALNTMVGTALSGGRAGSSARNRNRKTDGKESASSGRRTRASGTLDSPILDAEVEIGGLGKGKGILHGKGKAKGKGMGLGIGKGKGKIANLLDDTMDVDGPDSDADLDADGDPDPDADADSDPNLDDASNLPDPHVDSDPDHLPDEDAEPSDADVLTKRSRTKSRAKSLLDDEDEPSAESSSSSSSSEDDVVDLDDDDDEDLDPAVEILDEDDEEDSSDDSDDAVASLVDLDLDEQDSDAVASEDDDDDDD